MTIKPVLKKTFGEILESTNNVYSMFYVYTTSIFYTISKFLLFKLSHFILCRKSHYYFIILDHFISMCLTYIMKCYKKIFEGVKLRA